MHTIIESINRIWKKKLNDLENMDTKYIQNSKSRKFFFFFSEIQGLRWNRREQINPKHSETE
jgi:hypothetical protein